MKQVRVQVKCGAVACGALAFLLAGSSWAHHSFAAEYNKNDLVKVTGAVTKIEWQNPHVYFYVDVLDKKTGKVANWAWEMGAPQVIQRNDWKRTSLKIGDLITVTGFRARTKSDRGFVRSVVMTKTGKRLGKKLFRPPSATQGQHRSSAR